ncbi:MAG: hypothetical protein HQL58_13860, partial [Magnetococcales bacterium]|nr:hypothetical protein [Magnetococcales bacterium]
SSELPLIVGDIPIFDLYRYPEAVSGAVYHSLNFFGIDITLTGKSVDKQQNFNQVKDRLLSVATIIASDPELTEDLELADGYNGNRVLLLVSTILKQDILLGLVQLPAERVHSIPIPEEMLNSTLVLTENDPIDEDLLSPQNHEDIFEEVKLGEVEKQVRQAYFEGLEKQRLAEEEQQARKVQEEQTRQAQEEQERQHRAMLAAAKAKAEQELEDQRRAMLVEAERLRKQAALAKATSKSAWPSAKRTAIWLATGGVALVALLLWNPKISDKPPTLPATKEVAAPPVPTQKITPAVDQATPVQATPDRVILPVVPTVDSEQDNKSKLAQPAITSIVEKEKSIETVKTGTGRASLAAFANQLTPMDRLRDDPQYTITIPTRKNNTPVGLAFKRNRDGSVTFSIATLMNSVISRTGTAFALTPDTVSGLRLVFQVNPMEAYMFEFDRSGQSSVPQEFWQLFSNISQKAVSVSHVTGKTGKAIQLRDITAIKTRDIVKQLDR